MACALAGFVFIQLTLPSLGLGVDGSVVSTFAVALRSAKSLLKFAGESIQGQVLGWSCGFPHSAGSQLRQAPEGGRARSEHSCTHGAV